MTNIFEIFRERKAKLDALAAQRAERRKAKARIRIKSRIDEILDPKSSKRLFDDLKPTDPLDFPDYGEKAKELAKRSSFHDAVLCKAGTIDGSEVVMIELLPEFMMGSMGVVVGETVTLAAEYALDKQIPLILISASGGARMQEGMYSLMQMAKTAAALKRLHNAGILCISILTHPTTGGVTASFASLGDITLAEPGALIGFAGPRVIEQTIGTRLPEGFQSAEFQLEHGFVDAIVAREQLRSKLCALLALHPGASVSSANRNVGYQPATSSLDTDSRELGAGSAPTTDKPVAPARPEVPSKPAASTNLEAPAASRSLTALRASLLHYNKQPLKKLAPQKQVELARLTGRPHFGDFTKTLFDDFFELRGDRHLSDDRSLVCGIASFEGIPVSIAGHVKGNDLSSNIASNFGMPHPEGYRKYQRCLALAQKFNRPVINFIDTPGAYPGTGAEERGQGEAIARCLYEMSDLDVPVIAIVTGEGGSGGALALGVADVVLMYEHTIYSVLSPEGFASILWKDAKRAEEASEVMKLTSHDLLAFGMIDAIIPEPSPSAADDSMLAIETLRPYIRMALEALMQTDREQLLEERYERFRKFR